MSPRTPARPLSPGGCSGCTRVSRGLAALPYVLSLRPDPDLCPGAQVHFLALWSQGRKRPLRASPVSARVQGRGRPRASSRGSGLRAASPPHTHTAARRWPGCPRLCDRAGQAGEAAGSVALISRAALSQGTPSPEGKQFNQQSVASAAGARGSGRHAGPGLPGLPSLCAAESLPQAPGPILPPLGPAKPPTLGPLSPGPGCPPPRDQPALPEFSHSSPRHGLIGDNPLPPGGPHSWATPAGRPPPTPVWPPLPP